MSLKSCDGNNLLFLSRTAHHISSVLGTRHWTEEVVILLQGWDCAIPYTDAEGFWGGVGTGPHKALRLLVA